MLFLPAGDTLSAAAIGQNPGKHREVRQAMAGVFGVSPDEPLKTDVRRAQDRQNFYVFWYYVKKNSAGGQALFLPNTHPWLIDYVLKMVMPLRDVDIQQPTAPLRRGNEYESALTYIHKVKDGKDIYFFANSSPKDIDTKVVLRGNKTLEIRNSHTGERQKAEFARIEWADGDHGAGSTAVGKLAVLRGEIRRGRSDAQAKACAT